MPFSISLQHKNAIVTGAASGIGRGIALELAAAGATVFCCGLEARESVVVQALLQDLHQHSNHSTYHVCDVTDDNALENWLMDVAKLTGGKLDIIVSNAGRNTFNAVAATTAQQWDEALKLNLRSHWRLAQGCRNMLLQSGNGVIIIISSNHAFNTLPNCFPYNAAKAALVAMVQSLALEWGPSIRAVGLAPGFIETEGNNAWFDSHEHPQQKRDEVLAMHPVKALGTPKQIGGWVVFLASEYAAFVSGTTYLVDGGRSAGMQ